MSSLRAESGDRYRSDAAVSCLVGLGANLGQPLQQLWVAGRGLAWELADTRMVAFSRVYRSAPVGPPDQPDYLNAVAELHTRLAPEEMLASLLRLETRAGRVRADRIRWGPRVLDLDLLLYGDQQINLPDLQVPHPRMLQRAFVLWPLRDVAPERRVPGSDQTIQTLCAACAPEGLQVVAPGGMDWIEAATAGVGWS